MKIVIIGAGFAGLKIARKLNNKKGFEILLVDKFNYHQFQPLFYQVATSGLDASNISFPLRKAFQNSKNVRIRLATVQKIEVAKKEVITDMGVIPYDTLIIATGADTNWFGNKDLEENALPMKSTVEALQLRHRLLQNFEDALIAKRKIDLERLLTIVIVGGGPTGVELSGAIADLKRFVLPKDYPEIDFSKMRICLVEGLDKTLAAMSIKSSRQSKEYLEKLGVEVILNTTLTGYDGKTATLNNGEKIETATIIWAAGVKGNVPAGIEKELIARGNRIKVDRFNRVVGFENIYALGDVAIMETPNYPNGHPQVATVAIDQATNLAKNLLKASQKKHEWRAFEYKDKGSMATVGRNLAVVDIPRPKLHLGGFLAWWVWMTLHLFLILGVKNRLQIFINWAYNYLTYDQNLRLIFKEFYKPTKLNLTGKEENDVEETLG